MLVAAFLLELLEIADGVDQLVQVLDATDVLGGVVAHEHALDLGAANGLGSHCQRVFPVLIELNQAVHQGREAFQLGHGAAVHVQAILLGMVHHLPHAHAVHAGAVGDFAHGGVADAAGGVVDDASHGLVIVGIDDEPEVADGVFHLLALIERQPAVDAVGDGVAHVAVLVAAAAVAQRLLEHTRLGVGAVEHGIILVAVALAGLQGGNLVGHDIGFLIVAEALYHRNAVSHLVLAEQVLGNLALVFLDEAVGGIGDGLGRAVIAFELKGLDIGIKALQPEDIVDIGPAKAVDALRVVAHDTQAVIFLAQLVNNQMLREVGVLVLVDQNVAEEILVTLQHVGVVAQQDVGVQQQVVKVHRPGDAAAAPVSTVDAGGLGTLRVAVGIDEGLVAGIVLGGDQGVLGVADLVLYRGGFIDLVVEAHVLDDEFDERARVALVIDGEIGLEAQQLGIAP